MKITKEAFLRRIKVARNSNKENTYILTNEKYEDKYWVGKVKTYDSIESLEDYIFVKLNRSYRQIDIRYNEERGIVTINISEQGKGIIHAFDGIYLCPINRVGIFRNPNGPQYDLSYEMTCYELDKFVGKYYIQI